MGRCLLVRPHATQRRDRHPQGTSNSKHFGLQWFIVLCPERLRVVSPSVNVIQKRPLTVRIKRGFQGQCQRRHKQIDATGCWLLAIGRWGAGGDRPPITGAAPLFTTLV